MPERRWRVRLRAELGRRWQELRAVGWWRAHWIMFLPWMVVGLALLIGLGVWLAEPSFRQLVDGGMAALASGDKVEIRAWFGHFGGWTWLVIYAVMSLQVLVVGVPASVLLFSTGVVFGPVWGSVLNLAGRTTGGLIAFGVARWMGKGAVERLVGRITEADEFAGWLHRWGGLAVFGTRAIPGMPSDILSYVAGFTTIRWRTFFWATVTGFLPQCVVYAWLGDRALGWFWWLFLGGFLLTFVAGGVVWLVRRYAPE